MRWTGIGLDCKERSLGVSELRARGIRNGSLKSCVPDMKSCVPDSIIFLAKVGGLDSAYMVLRFICVRGGFHVMYPPTEASSPVVAS